VNSVGHLTWVLNEFVKGGFRLPGVSANVLLNLQNNRIKDIALKRLFLPTFLAVAKKYVKRRDSFEKGMNAVCSAHRWRSHKKTSLSSFFQ
jgi:hypothetical protein